MSKACFAYLFVKWRFHEFFLSSRFVICELQSWRISFAGRLKQFTCIASQRSAVEIVDTSIVSDFHRMNNTHLNVWQTKNSINISFHFISYAMPSSSNWPQWLFSPSWHFSHFDIYPSKITMYLCVCFDEATVRQVNPHKNVTFEYHDSVVSKISSQALGKFIDFVDKKIKNCNFKRNEKKRQEKCRQQQ